MATPEKGIDRTLLVVLGLIAECGVGGGLLLWSTSSSLSRSASFAGRYTPVLLVALLIVNAAGLVAALLGRRVSQGGRAGFAAVTAGAAVVALVLGVTMGDSDMLFLLVLLGGLPMLGVVKALTEKR